MTNLSCRVSGDTYRRFSQEFGAFECQRAQREQSTRPLSGKERVRDAFDALSIGRYAKLGDIERAILVGHDEFLHRTMGELTPSELKSVCEERFGLRDSGVAADRIERAVELRLDREVREQVVAHYSRAIQLTDHPKMKTALRQRQRDICFGQGKIVDFPVIAGDTVRRLNLASRVPRRDSIVGRTLAELPSDAAPFALRTAALGLKETTWLMSATSLGAIAGGVAIFAAKQALKAAVESGKMSPEVGQVLQLLVEVGALTLTADFKAGVKQAVVHEALMKIAEKGIEGLATLAADSLARGEPQLLDWLAGVGPFPLALLEKA